MRRALAAAIGGILLVPGVLFADDSVPVSPPALPATAPAAAPASAPPGDGAVAAGQPQEMSKPPQPAQPAPVPVAKKNPKPKPKPDQAEAHAAAAGSVIIKNFAFGPATISVNAGDTVTWTNQDSAAHTATGSGGSFNTGTLKKGQSGSHTFSKAGRFAYICAIHPNMRGTVVVAGASTSSPGAGGGSAGSSGSAGQPATGAQSSAPSGPTLPNTGLELLVVILLGTLFTLGGAALHRIARRA